MNAETPQITTSYYGSATTCLPPEMQWSCGDGTAVQPVQARALDRLLASNQVNFIQPLQPPQIQFDMPKENPTRRIVQVFIADPNENVPLAKSVLYTGEQKLTDLNDTELFFEVPIKDLLDKHNAFRVTVPDREASKRAGKDILLDPVKIRELKMVVVTIAQF